MKLYEIASRVAYITTYYWVVMVGLFFGYYYGAQGQPIREVVWSTATFYAGIAFIQYVAVSYVAHVNLEVQKEQQQQIAELERQYYESRKSEEAARASESDSEGKPFH